MPLSLEQYASIDNFAEQADFKKGGLVLDLDGTTLLEYQGKVVVDGAVERALKRIHDYGRPVVLNTLRFPKSVMWTVAKEWFEIINDPIPTVLLNGSVVGSIHNTITGFEYRETVSFPLSEVEIDTLVSKIDRYIYDGIRDIVLFFYPRDWRVGEVIWTPEPVYTERLKKKYYWASDVISVSSERLQQMLKETEVVMMQFLVDRPEDELMAYQHTSQNSFVFTHEGINKSFGLNTYAKIEGLSLSDSLGAGDTIMDNFLADVGVALIVGEAHVPYLGKISTVRVKDPIELAVYISSFADRIRSYI